MNNCSDALKRLQTRLHEKRNLYKTYENEKNHIQSKITLVKKEIDDINNQIKKMTNSELNISEHAILRYLERVQNINIEEIKKEILTEELKLRFKTLGNGTYVVNGISYKIHNGNIVTTIKKEKVNK